MMINDEDVCDMVDRRKVLALFPAGTIAIDPHLCQRSSPCKRYSEIKRFEIKQSNLLNVNDQLINSSLTDSKYLITIIC